MASSSVVTLVVCLGVMAMVLDGPVAEALTCGQVQSSLSPCVKYLKFGGPVPMVCCNRVRSLKSAAKTKADRQAACKCLKSAAKSVKKINMNLAAGLPRKCGVSLRYKISLSTNCASVK